MRGARNVVSLQREGLDPSMGIEEAIVGRASVVEGLLRLPDVQREVVILRFLVGMSVPEVALTIGKSEGRVKELQHRGLARLRVHEAEAEQA